MRLIAVDPGSEESAYVVYDDRDGFVCRKGILPNDELLSLIREWDPFLMQLDKLVIEMVASYGMPVGRTVFETCVWIGRFIEAWGGPFEKVYRQDVKMHICKDSRAKDPNIRQALIDLYPPSGGGATPQIGIKSDPGPLYGFKSHLWSALAVAVTAAEAA